MNYILVGHTPVPEPDTLKWAAWLETANRGVAEDFIGDVRVSTVFLGIDHNWSKNGPPHIFETMVFGGPLDGQERYSTWDEAVEGHKRMVHWVCEMLERMP